MRGKQKIFKDYIEKLKQTDDFAKIQDLLATNKYFLGVREDYLSIYYMGMSIAKVEIKNQGIKYKLSYYYLKGVKDNNGVKIYDNKEKGYFSLSSEMFWNKDNFNQIIENVEKHVLGFGNDNKTYLEKACQQWIINTNNNDPNSAWYYVDMEYIYKEDGKKENHPFGRADIIAISKKPNDKGIFNIAFVELKVGTGAYNVTIKVPEGIKNAGKADEYRKEVKACLGDKDKFWEIKDVKLGSGLASHVVDYMHFFSNEKAKEQLQQEILGIIEVHKQFDLISKDAPLYTGLSSGAKISKTSDIYIVTYSEVPEIKKNRLSIEAQNKYEVPSMPKMKEQFAKYFFDVKGSSSMNIENLINNEVIQGFIGLKQKYIAFAQNDEMQIECMQKIGDTDYRFIFRFIDIKDENINPANCIG